jgi:hypothetical protein
MSDDKAAADFLLEGWHPGLHGGPLSDPARQYLREGIAALIGRARHEERQLVVAYLGDERLPWYHDFGPSIARGEHVKGAA